LVDEVMGALTRRGQSVAAIFGDLVQAFYKVDRRLLYAHLGRVQESRHLVVRVVRRHTGVEFYMLAADGSRVCVHASDGVIVGDSLGPLLFVLYFAGFISDLQARRRRRRPGSCILAVLTELCPPGGAPPDDPAQDVVEVSDVVFVDEHVALAPVRDWGDIAHEGDLIQAVQVDWRLQSNFE
jgi:hypothetical protein